MATAKQILANRANAAKSTGPRTEKGRAKSSRNNLRHGALSQAILLKGESEERFSYLLDQFRDEFQPHWPSEFALVEVMAVARWRQMRIWSLERANLDYEIEKQAAADQNPDLDAATCAALAFRTLADESRSLDLLARYDAAFERQYNRALDRLTKLRDKRESAIRTQL